jgi:3-phosphoshikimate 1-carboxyvinyltransferase
VDEIEITPLAAPFVASIRVPGSKSIANRALLIAAMARGSSVLEAVGLNDDTRRMIDALRTLGFRIAIDEAAARITVEGSGGTIAAHGAELFVGGAGTAMRFLAGFVTLGEGRFRIDGDQRMRERPIGPLLDAMQRLGASVFSERNNRCPPIVIGADAASERFSGGATEIDARESSQFVSALLMPAPLWRDGLTLKVAGDAARPFIAMTLDLMRAWGVRCALDGDTITVPGGQSYRAQHFAVEPDASSASYFAAAAALVNGTVTLEGLSESSIQGDTQFLGVLKRMGARVTWSKRGVEVAGTGRLRGVDLAMNAMPDMVATLAALAPFAASPTRIRGVAFIRHHESDRIAALATELRKLGAAVEEFDDGLAIQPSQLHGGTVETYDDHRIAMSFAVAGLKTSGIRITNPACVAKTFPDFFAKLKSLGRGALS